MSQREAFEAHIKSMIETEAGEAQALAKDPDGEYITQWVRHQWWGFHAAIQHARDVAVKACEEQAKEPECPERAIYCADAIKEALK